MKALFWLLALFALAVAVALGARYNDGYVLLVMPPYRTEISLNLFIVAFAVLVFALYGVLRALSLTFGLPQRAREYRERRQHDQAAAVFQDAVRLLFEGRFGQALKKATEAHKAGTAPGLSALIAARAAQRMRETQKQQGWMQRAKLDDPRTEAATLMLEAEMMNEARQFSAALVALDRLQAKQGRHIAALRLELRARQGVKDWDGVLKLARQLVKRDALPVEVVREICTQAHLANIARRAGDLDAWAPKLVSIYGRLAGGDQMARIAKAEAWLRRHPKDASILLALGRMCFRKRLWGKAQTYLDASLAVEVTQEAHLELARLCDQLERTEEANKHYRASALLDAR